MWKLPKWLWRLLSLSPFRPFVRIIYENGLDVNHNTGGVAQKAMEPEMQRVSFTVLMHHPVIEGKCSAVRASRGF